MTETQVPRIVWLASFPKSGNTWMRAIVTALNTHSSLFNVDQLGSGWQPHGLAGVLSMGLDARWLTAEEGLSVRDSQIRNVGVAAGSDVEEAPPLLRKTHEVYRVGQPSQQPFPTEASRAAIHIVRDPRDVACSYAPFFGLSLDGAIDALGSDGPQGPGSAAQMVTTQPWGSWSSHALSWLDDQPPFPVHLVRYEDLLTDAVAILAPVFEAIGLTVDTAELRQAVDRTRFERLQAAEEKQGFREVSKRTSQFFRSGRSGGWRAQLDPVQVAAIESDHSAVMQRLGYELTTTEDDREEAAALVRDRRKSASAANTQAAGKAVSATKL